MLLMGLRQRCGSAVGGRSRRPLASGCVIDRLRAGSGRRPTGEALGVLLVLVSAAGFGSGALLVQPLYERGMDPLVALFWRFGTAALFGWGFLLLSRRSRASLRSLPARRLALLAGLGFLYVANSYAYFASLQAVPITLASIIAYLYPAIVAVLATRLVRRLEGPRAWIALGISMVGVALAIGGIPAGALPPLWALALAVANPVIYATWIVLQARMAGDRPIGRAADRRRRSGRAAAGHAVADPEQPAALDAAAGPGPEAAHDAVHAEPAIVLPPGDAEAPTGAPDPAPAAAIMTTATATLFAVLVLLTGGSISPLDVPAGAWPAVLGFGLIATAFAIQAFYAGVKRVGGARASLISTVEPVYTVVLAMILFGERLTPLQWLGGALVIGAVLLAETGRGDRGRESSTVAQDRSPA